MDHKVRSQSANHKPKIAIAGAGPAGSSLAIRLVDAGFETVLVERKRFPRQKLCGEFISPECLTHFEKLGVLESMLDAGGDRIFETRFFEMGGRSVSVPSKWFGSGDFALGLSRAEMDHQLLERARQRGAQVLEGISIAGIESEGGLVSSLHGRADDGTALDIDADIFVDATGRGSIVAKLLEKSASPATVHSRKPSFVGFKVHLADAGVPKGMCEIYSFRGGYAGSSAVEGGLANLCFLIKSDVVRANGSNADAIVERVVSRNKRAAVNLKNATPVGEWLAVSVDGFGTTRLAPAENFFTVGDAASFIDPFTGSGMVMALESSEVLAGAITEGQRIAGAYESEYRTKFARRLRICSLLRRTAFMPTLATGIVTSLSVSSSARRFVARATRR